MTNPHEERAREDKVDTFVGFLRDAYQGIPVPSFQCWSFDDSRSGEGVEGPRPSITEWVTAPDFPWSALERAAKLKRPCSPTTKAMVLAALGEGAG